MVRTAFMLDLYAHTQTNYSLYYYPTRYIESNGILFTNNVERLHPLRMSLNYRSIVLTIPLLVSGFVV